MNNESVPSIIHDDEHIFTILESVETPPGKVWTLDESGGWSKTTTAAVARWKHSTRRADSLESLCALLERVSSNPRAVVIRGQITSTAAEAYQEQGWTPRRSRGVARSSR